MGKRIVNSVILLTLLGFLVGCVSTSTPADPTSTEYDASLTPEDDLTIPEATITQSKTPSLYPSQTETVVQLKPTETEQPPTPASQSDANILAELGYIPVFEPAPCKFTLPEGFKPECGFLTVPEDRSDPEGSQVRLHVAIYRSRNSNPAPDPVIYLTGGGGGNELDRAIRYLDEGNDAILDNRDFIMYSQRGTKFNHPFLECHGYAELVQELVFQHLPKVEIEQRIVEYLAGCREEYRDLGYDLNMYNTAVNAADLNDLRIALGYDQINIYGTSYGTRLALYILRDYGEHIRSAIIDSVYPPQIHYYSTFATNAFNTFEKIFDACSANENCDRKYPELETIFYQAVDELNANPRYMDFNGNRDAIKYDGDNFVTAMYLFPYISQTEYFPAVVYQVMRGDYSTLEDMIPYTIDIGGEDVIADAVHYSIQCREEIPFDSYQQRLEMGKDLPSQIAGAYSSPFEFNLCARWDVAPAPPTDRDPVVSDVPTLILAGEFDPITPPEWSILAGETLSNSFYYEFPGHGHGVMRSVPCGFEVGLQFLNDPYNQPDAACVEELPEFEFR